jgi:glycerol-3-phosphate acyltransferase PlsY
MGMIYLFLGIVAYGVGVIPNALLLKGFLNKKRLGYVRCDMVGSYNILMHIKEPEFYMTLILDLIKGMSLVLLAQWLSSETALGMILLLIAVIARNLNPIIGIRNGVGITIIIGGLLVYAPLVVFIFMTATTIFYMGIHDLDTSFALSSISIPITLGLMSDSLLVLLIGFLLVMAVFVQKMLYVRAAAFRTRYKDHTRGNPFA